MFFGENAQRYAMDKITMLWNVQEETLAGRHYFVMRVPHTSPQSFNTHGRKGLKYIEAFDQLYNSIRRPALP